MRYFAGTIVSISQKSNYHRNQPNVGKYTLPWVFGCLYVYIDPGGFDSTSTSTAAASQVAATSRAATEQLDVTWPLA